MTSAEELARDGLGDGDLADRIAFLMEIDQLKRVERRSWITGESRVENSAEHSWYLGMFVLVLAPLADEPIDVARAVQMALVHDIVEVDAGDVVLYDEQARADHVAVEIRAAGRLYGLLPQLEGAGLRQLWDEFEARESPEARFVAAVDRLAPTLLNHATNGRTWQSVGVGPSRVRSANSHIAAGSARLGALANAVFDDAERAGMFGDADQSS